jgi:capsular polysaccharide transport system permease protein
VSATAGRRGQVFGLADGRPSAREGFRVQARVIHALLLRELTTRFGRSQLGFIWLFLEPLLLATTIGLLHWAIGRGAHRAGEAPIFLFFVVGYAPYFAFRAIINRAPSAFTSNMTLMYHRQVRLLDIALARNLLEAAAVMCVLLLIVGASAWLVGIAPHSIPVLVGALLLLFAFANGIGLLAAAGAARWEAVERIIHPLTYLSLPFSGALFSLHQMPLRWREALLWNPQANIHEMVREGMFGDIMVTHFDMPYVLAWVVMVNLLGLAAIRAVRPQLEF